MVLLVHMADKRRLQGEIDKTLKKVNEGVEAFDDIWQKLDIVSRIQVQTATNLNQKEKYETELKKEIKKLQRLREQIKTWQNSNDIKDKKPLQEARKNIEQQMERFKAIERETKQKPYSKDALGGSYKFDPLQKEKEEIGQWIKASNSKLNSQVEELEAKLEDLNANKKKRVGKEKIESTKHRIEMNKKYIDNLERISNIVKKNLISIKKIQEIKDDVDFYVEHNEQGDFSENMDNLDIFDDLELDKYDSTASGIDNENDDNENDKDTDNDEDDDENDDEDDDDDEANENNTNQTGGSHHAANTNTNSNNNNNEDELVLSQSPTSSNLSKSNSPSVINTVLNNSISNMNYGSTSSSSSTSSSGSANNDERRRHKSESGLNNENNVNSNNNNNNSSSENQRNASNQQQNAHQNHQANNRRNNNQNSNHNTTNNSGTSRNRTNSGTAGSTASNLNSNNKIPPFNHSSSTSNTGASPTSASNPTTTPPLSQSPFAAVVAHGTASQPVSFSAAVATTPNQANKPNPKQTSYSSQVKGLSTTVNSNSSNTISNSENNSSSNFINELMLQQSNSYDQNQINNTQTTSPNSTNPSSTNIPGAAALLLSQQQQLSNLLAVAAANQNPNAPHLNGLINADAMLDKKLADVSNAQTQLNTLKSMAENAILLGGQNPDSNDSHSPTNTAQSQANVNLQQLLSAAATAPGDLPIASLLATLQQQHSLSNDSNQTGDQTNNATAALAALLSQQKLNIPAALSVLQQQQSFNNSGLIVPSSLSQQNSLQSQQQQLSISPSLLMNQQSVNSTNQETFIQPILGVAPLGKTPLSKEQQSQSAMLDCAFKKLPQPSDTERIRNYLPRITVNTPSYYPMAPPNGHDSLDFLCKLHSDTLFFMFYYMEGTKAQFLAAQALKKLSWRFHTRYMMWFQRFEEPKVITDEYENGTYILFDYEKWAPRKKENFTFEYKYLEDIDLSKHQVAS